MLIVFCCFLHSSLFSQSKSNVTVIHGYSFVEEEGSHCCSRVSRSGSVGSPLFVVTAWAYVRGLVSNPLIIMSFIRVYCSRSATRHSKWAILLSFSAFYLFSFLTSPSSHYDFLLLLDRYNFSRHNFEQFLDLLLRNSSAVYVKYQEK